jgi:hypothetical protein
MPSTTNADRYRNWRWSKPVHWADIVRSLLITGELTDASVNTMFQLREHLKRRIAEGTVKQLSRGVYSLLQEPAQEPVPQPSIVIHPPLR